MSRYLKITQNAIQKRLVAATRLEASSAAFLNRSIYPLYQRAQEERWKTENTSEGQRWKRISFETSRRKIKDRIRDRAMFPGGPRVGVHTGDLSRSVIGVTLENHRKVITGKKLTVATSLGYAGFFADVRPIMEFGQKTKSLFKSRVKAFWRGYIKNATKAGL